MCVPRRRVSDGGRVARGGTQYRCAVVDGVAPVADACIADVLSHPDRYRQRTGQSYADNEAYSDLGDQNADAHSDRHPDADADRDRHADADCDGHANADADAHEDDHPDAHCDGHTDADRHADRDSDAHRDGYPDANCDGHTDCARDSWVSDTVEVVSVR